LLELGRSSLSRFTLRPNFPCQSLYSGHGRNGECNGWASVFIAEHCTLTRNVKADDFKPFDFSIRCGAGRSIEAKSAALRREAARLLRYCIAV